jgi:hypothetical protein
MILFCNHLLTCQRNYSLFGKLRKDETIKVVFKEWSSEKKYGMLDEALCLAGK